MSRHIADMTAEKIRHTVVFALKHPQGSPKTKAFLQDARRILTTIPNVENFECLRQVSRKNAYQYGFSMEFRDQAAYDAYSSHPDHNRFVQERWLPEVREFLEIDYVLEPAL